MATIDPSRVLLFVSSIASTPKMRSNHETARQRSRQLHAQALQVARALAGIGDYKRVDISMDEEAKALWKRKNGGSTELPMILVDNEPVGSIEQLAEAVEFRELHQFLRLDRPAPTLDADESLLEGLSQADADKLVAELDKVDATHDALAPTSAAVAPVAVEADSQTTELDPDVAALDPLQPSSEPPSSAAAAASAPSSVASDLQQLSAA